MSLTRLIAVSIALVALIAACDASAPTGSGAPEACPPVAVTGPDGQPVDLSGSWDGNDGGLYYMKQIDSCLWWSGVSNFATQYPGEEWIMTFKGHITSDGVIRGDFVDVKSGNPGSGTMTISIRVDQVENVGPVVNLYRTESTGHEIGVTFWRRATPSPSPEPSPAESSAPESAPASASPAAS